MSHHHHVDFSSRILVIQYYRVDYLDDPLCKCVELCLIPPTLLVYLKVLGVVRWAIVRYQRVTVAMRAQHFIQGVLQLYPLGAVHDLNVNKPGVCIVHYVKVVLSPPPAL